MRNFELISLIYINANRVNNKKQKLKIKFKL